MGRILAKIQKDVGKFYCFFWSTLFFMFAFVLIWMISIGFSDVARWLDALLLFLSLISGSLFFAAGRHNTDWYEDIAEKLKPHRFFTLNENGNIVLTEISVPPPLDLKETRREDGRIDISMQIHSKEQAVEVLAALAVMYDKGGIAADDYHGNVRKIREHFNL